jgi:hypothetical protein
MQKQSVEEVLRDLIDRNDGSITPQIVLQEAKKAKSALHSHFNWDDGEAANQWRLSQAAELIRKVKVTVVFSPERTVRVRAFMNVVPKRDADDEGETPATSGVYVTIENAMKNHREEILTRAMSELNCVKGKYSHLKELVGVWEAIDKV